eukprot:gene10861-3479_t
MGNSPSLNETEHDDVNKFFNNSKTRTKRSLSSNSNSQNQSPFSTSQLSKMSPFDFEGTLTKKLCETYQNFKHKNKITKIIYDEKTNLIWTTSIDKTICGWSLDGSCKSILVGHTKQVTNVFIHEYSLFSAGHDRTIIEWDTRTSQKIKIYEGNTNWITNLLVINNFLFSAGYEQVIHIFDRHSSKKIKTLKGHQKRIVGMCFNEELGLLFTASIDGLVRSWDIDSGEGINIFHSNQAVFNIFIHQNLLYCTLYSEIIVWNIEQQKCETPFVGISNFTIDNDILIGWNRMTLKFEFINLKSRNVIHSIKDENMIHTNSILYLNQKLYYTFGSTVNVKDVKFDEKRMSLIKEEKINLDEILPSYVLYQELYRYYVDVLFYSSQRISDAIEKLHNDKTLSKCTSFDGQIDAISDYLKKDEKRKLSRFSISSSFDKIDFKISIQSKQEEIIDVYTKQERGLDFESRTELFYEKIRANSVSLQPTVILVRRDHLVSDTCKHFSVLKKKDLQKPMYIFFAGEQGLDMGGVTREFYQLLSEQILDPINALFVQTGFNNTYHPNPTSQINEAHLQYFMFVGKLIGKAIYDFHMCDLHFSRVIFKLIVGKPITFEDLEQIEPTLYLSMNQIMQLDDASVLDISFIAEDNDFGTNNTYELIENGDNIIVDEKNKHKFVELYSKYKLIDSVRPQLEKLLDGLYEIIPKEYFTIFNEKEFELLLCGSPELNVEDWKKNTKLEGFDKDSMYIVEGFWKMVENMDCIERSKLLQFCTGTACVPHEGFEGIYPHFTLCRLRVGKDYLPVAHTCLNRLDLPDYDEQQLFLSKFEKALELGLKEGFQLD